MKKIILGTLLALSLASCSSKPEYNRDRVVSLLEKQAGWTQKEYAEMFDQLQATQIYLQDNCEALSDEECEFLLRANSDLNYYLIEALNDGLLDEKTASDMSEWLHDNQ